MKIPDIIKLKPNRVWRTYPGGLSLDKLEGKTNPADSYFPEDWIASTTKAVNIGREDVNDEGLTKVDLCGKEFILKNLCEKYPEEVLGKKHFDKYGSNIGFLMKFLDSAVRLHIQCHPTISFAKKYLNSDKGKTEAYVILQTRKEVENPYIFLGFQRPPNPHEFRDAILTQNSDFILNCFDKIFVKPGDVFIVPGGIPHAIGEGVFMLEIMEPTDFAVRIEFERGGYVLPEQSRFMGRGVDFALSMFDFSEFNKKNINNKFFAQPNIIRQFSSGSFEESLIDERLTNCFSVRKLTVNQSVEKSEPGFYVVVVTKGEGVISGVDFSEKANFGDRFLIPATADKINYKSEKEMELILTFPPE